MRYGLPQMLTGINGKYFWYNQFYQVLLVLNWNPKEITLASPKLASPSDTYLAFLGGLTGLTNPFQPQVPTGHPKEIRLASLALDSPSSTLL